LESGKDGGQKCISKFRINFCYCTNPALIFALCDPPRWLNLVSEPNIKGSEEDGSIKLSAVFAAGNLSSASLESGSDLKNAWRSLHQLQYIFWNTDVRD